MEQLIEKAKERKDEIERLRAQLEMQAKII